MKQYKITIEELLPQSETDRYPPTIKTFELLAVRETTLTAESIKAVIDAVTEKK